MFTLPPWPPEDYVLKNVAKDQQSAEFTPMAIPRSTQNNLAKYLYPIPYKGTNKVKPEIQEVHPKIVENMVQQAKAWWVDKPGLCHFQPINSQGPDIKNNPVFQHKEKVFNRPFFYEMDCMEFLRLKKLQQKTDKECEMKCKYITGLQQGELMKQKNGESSKITACDWEPPFWWKDATPNANSTYSIEKPCSSGLPGDYGTIGPIKSWQETPNYFRKTEDPCIRRRELLMVGLPFRNEGCNWYYKNYPPPKSKLKPQRFSK